MRENESLKSSRWILSSKKGQAISQKTAKTGVLIQQHPAMKKKFLVT
jgi:hypothetical protein